jgi:hypothetical protein
MNANSSANTGIKAGGGYKTNGAHIKLGKGGKVSLKSPQNERRDMASYSGNRSIGGRG